MRRFWGACAAALCALLVVLALEMPAPWPTAPRQAYQAVREDKIPVNTASAADLQLLPGIGEKRAQAIIEYRREHGAISGPQDLALVDGISDEMAQELAPMLCFS